MVNLCRAYNVTHLSIRHCYQHSYFCTVFYILIDLGLSPGALYAELATIEIKCWGFFPPPGSLTLCCGPFFPSLEVSIIVHFFVHSLTSILMVLSISLQEFAEIYESLYWGYDYYFLYWGDDGYSLTDKFKFCNRKVARNAQKASTVLKRPIWIVNCGSFYKEVLVGLERTVSEGFEVKIYPRCRFNTLV